MSAGTLYSFSVVVTSPGDSNSAHRGLSVYQLPLIGQKRKDEPVPQDSQAKRQRTNPPASHDDMNVEDSSSCSEEDGVHTGNSRVISENAVSANLPARKVYEKFVKHFTLPSGNPENQPQQQQQQQQVSGKKNPVFLNFELCEDKLINETNGRREYSFLPESRSAGRSGSTPVTFRYFHAHTPNAPKQSRSQPTSPRKTSADETSNKLQLKKQKSPEEAEDHGKSQQQQHQQQGQQERRQPQEEQEQQQQIQRTQDELRRLSLNSDTQDQQQHSPRRRDSTPRRRDGGHQQQQQQQQQHHHQQQQHQQQQQQHQHQYQHQQQQQQQHQHQQQQQQPPQQQQQPPRHEPHPQHVQQGHQRLTRQDMPRLNLTSHAMQEGYSAQPPMIRRVSLASGGSHHHQPPHQPQEQQEPQDPHHEFQQSPRFSPNVASPRPLSPSQLPRTQQQSPRYESNYHRPSPRAHSFSSVAGTGQQQRPPYQPYVTHSASLPRNEDGSPRHHNWNKEHPQLPILETLRDTRGLAPPYNQESPRGSSRPYHQQHQQYHQQQQHHHHHQHTVQGPDPNPPVAHHHQTRPLQEPEELPRHPQFYHQHPYASSTSPRSPRFTAQRTEDLAQHHCDRDQGLSPRPRHLPPTPLADSEPGFQRRRLSDTEAMATPKEENSLPPPSSLSLLLLNAENENSDSYSRILPVPVKTVERDSAKHFSANSGNRFPLSH